MDRRAFVSAAACSLLTASTQTAWAQTGGRFGAAEAYSAQRGGLSFLVARHGVILAESYSGNDPLLRLPIGEGARVFAPLLAAALAQDDLLNLDEPVALTLGDWGLHPVKSTISVRALMSGTSGIAFGRGDNNRSVATAIALEPRESPGLRFQDDPAPYILLSEIARRKLISAEREPDPARYLTNATLQAIGCVPIGWARGADGAARFDDGVVVSARGWAQAGELIRREGVWRAQQLADGTTLREALRGSFAEPRAGFGVWLAAPARNRADLSVNSDLWRASSPAPPGLAMAAGAGGQRLYISPLEGLIAVRQTRSTGHASDWSDAQFLSLIYQGLR